MKKLNEYEILFCFEAFVKARRQIVFFRLEQLILPGIENEEFRGVDQS